MAQKEDYITFSIRIPVTICNQIDAQARVTRRSRSMQCLNLIETALDIQALRNEKLKAELKESGA